MSMSPRDDAPSSAEVLREFDGPMLDAVVETMFIAAHADGEFGEAEREQFVQSVAKVTGGRVNRHACDALLSHLEASKTDDRAARLSAVKDRLPTDAMRRIAFSHAVRLVASDGTIRTVERELLLDLAETLEIDRDAAADMVRTLAGG